MHTPTTHSSAITYILRYLDIERTRYPKLQQIKNCLTIPSVPYISLFTRPYPGKR